MKPYKPSNIVPPEGIRNLTAIAIITGLATGGIVAAIGQFFYLIVLFPLVMGGAGGTAIAWGIKTSKVRNPVVGIAFASLTAMLTYASLNYFNYLNFRQLVSKEIATQGIQGESDRLVNTLLKEVTGSDGFVGYIKYTAKDGVQIKKGGSDIKFEGEISAYIYWSIEILIIEGLAILLAYGAAMEPFSEDDNSWYGEKQWRGTVPLDAQGSLLDLVKNDNFYRAGELISLTDIPLPRLDIYIREAPSGRMSDSFLIISKSSLNGKGEVESTEIISGMIGERDKNDFLRNTLTEISAAEFSSDNPLDQG